MAAPDRRPPDPRLVAARPDLAAERLRGVVAAPRYAAGTLTRGVAGVTPVWSGPARRMVATELLFGETFEVFDRTGDLAWGQAPRDGYVGWVAAAALTDPGPAPTHRVAALLTHLYPEPAAKAPPRAVLPFAAPVAVTGIEGAWAEVAGGFVPLGRLAALGEAEPDPVAVAGRFLGVPYLWGGRTALGIDCSGLVQTALMAAGIPCPRDSDQQAAAAGTALDPDEPLRRGDLVFWKGHAGLMQDGARLVHATGHHMGVVSEPLALVASRIARQGHGPVIARRRP